MSEQELAAAMRRQAQKLERLASAVEASDLSAVGDRGSSYTDREYLRRCWQRNAQTLARAEMVVDNMQTTMNATHWKE